MHTTSIVQAPSLALRVWCDHPRQLNRSRSRVANRSWGSRQKGRGREQSTTFLPGSRKTARPPAWSVWGRVAGLAGPLEVPPHGDAAASIVLRHAPTLRIIATAALIFICYFTIGLQLAVVPGFVYLDLGYSPLVAGLVVSAQYVATLASRPLAGRMGDLRGGKQTACWGLAGCAASGLVLLAAVLLRSYPLASLYVLLLSRLFLGVAESWVATGATIWGMAALAALSRPR